MSDNSKESMPDPWPKDANGKLTISQYESLKRQKDITYKPYEDKGPWFPSVAENFLRSFGDVEKGTAFSSALMMAGTNRTRKLSIDEIEDEIANFIAGKTVAFNVETGATMWFVSRNSTGIRFKKSRQFLPGVVTETFREDKLRHQFIMGYWVEEDSDRDPGGFGSKWFDKSIEIAKLMQIGGIQELSKIDATMEETYVEAMTLFDAKQF